MVSGMAAAIATAILKESTSQLGYGSLVLSAWVVNSKIADLWPRSAMRVDPPQSLAPCARTFNAGGQIYSHVVAIASLEAMWGLVGCLRTTQAGHTRVRGIYLGYTLARAH